MKFHLTVKCFLLGDNVSRKYRCPNGWRRKWILHDRDSLRQSEKTCWSKSTFWNGNVLHRSTKVGRFWNVFKINSTISLKRFAWLYREHDAGFLQVGVMTSKSYSLTIPPNSQEFVVSSHCPSECTSNIPDEGVNAFVYLLHSHLSGKKAFIEKALLLSIISLSYKFQVEKKKFDTSEEMRNFRLLLTMNITILIIRTTDTSGLNLNFYLGITWL